MFHLLSISLLCLMAVPILLALLALLAVPLSLLFGLLSIPLALVSVPLAFLGALLPWALRLAAVLLVIRAILEKPFHPASLIPAAIVFGLSILLR